MTDLPILALAGIGVGALAGMFLLHLAELHAWTTAPWVRHRAVNGCEGLIECRGRVVIWDADERYVRIDGERWKATGPDNLEVGDHVLVASVRGLTLEVEAADDR